MNKLHYLVLSESVIYFIIFHEQLFSWYGHMFLTLGYTLSGSFIIQAGE